MKDGRCLTMVEATEKVGVSCRPIRKLIRDGMLHANQYVFDAPWQIYNEDVRRPPSSKPRLGDWYVNLLTVRRQHLVLAVSGVTLLPVLVPAAPYKTVIDRFAEAAPQMLRALKMDEARIAALFRAPSREADRHGMGKAKIPG